MKTRGPARAAQRAAEEALLDRTVLSVNSTTYALFLARLDEPPQPNDRLRRTMQTNTSYETYKKETGSDKY